MFLFFVTIKSIQIARLELLIFFLAFGLCRCNGKVGESDRRKQKMVAKIQFVHLEKTID